MHHVVIISKTFVLTPAQPLLERLAAYPDLTLTLITPPSWHDPAGSPQPFIPRHTHGYRVLRTPIRWNGHFHRYLYRGLGPILDRLAPDLLHVDEEPYNPAAWQGLWHGRRLGIPTLLVAWQNLTRHYPPPYSWLEQWAYRQASGIIAGSSAAAAVLRAKGYRGPLPTFSLHGIAPELWPPRASPPPASAMPFIVGVIGRLVPEKGVDLLIEALALGPARIHLHIIGQGPEEPRLRALAVARGVVDRITWFGALDSAAIPAALRGCDALALPSRSRPNWTEQFGRVLVEAMASGVPVIGSASGEIPWVIGDAGLLVPEGDPVAWSHALARLSADPDLWHALAHRGRERALAQYTHAAIATRLAECYATLWAGSGP